MLFSIFIPGIGYFCLGLLLKSPSPVLGSFTPGSFSKTLTSRHRFTTYQSMRTDLWGQQKCILIVCFLLSKCEERSLNVAASSCGRGYFRKRFSCGRRYFFIRIKKDAFSKISGYVWTRPENYSNSHLKFPVGIMQQKSSKLFVPRQSTK